MERGRGGRVRKAMQNTHQVNTPLNYVRADGRAPDAHVGLDGVGDPIHLDFPRTAGRRSGRASSKGGRRQKGDHRLEAEEHRQGDDDRTLHLVEELTEGETKRAYVDVWGGGWESSFACVSHVWQRRRATSQASIAVNERPSQKATMTQQRN